jgi:hypothetical protein
VSLHNAYIRLNVKWAGKLGSTYNQYRPASGTNPTGTPYLIGTLSALFDASISLAFNAPLKYANQLFAAIVNPTSVQPQDYLIGPEGTFFVASTEPLKPILCVQCNRIATFYRPTPQAPAPSSSPRPYYGGDNASVRTTLYTNVPISQLQGTKGERNAAEQLPTDSRMQWSEVLLPAFPGVTLRQADRMTDDIGRNFVLSAVELTDLGWRITAEFVDA